MQAYNKTDLYNSYVQEQAAEAWHTDCISNDSYRNILEVHPCKLYTPNYFIRIALALLTIVAVLFAGLLFGLLFLHGGGDAAISILTLVFAIVCYGFLELLIKQKNYYNAGVDNILTTIILVLVQTALLIQSQNFTILSFITLIISLWLCLRFTDGFMAMIAYISLFVFVFMMYIKLGAFAKATAPFVMMLFSLLVHASISKWQDAKKFNIYAYSIKVVKLLTLLSLYASLNYFAVRELSNEMFHLNLQPYDTIPAGWLFWILTFAVPVFYFIYGIRKKDMMFLRTGIILFAVSCITFRYYHPIFPVEWMLLICGLLLTIIIYFLFIYLRTAKYGFTSAAVKHQHNRNIEALIIAQAFGKKTTATESGMHYGGGSSGGGGATGNF